MRKIILILFVMSISFIKGYSQSDVNIVFHVNPTLNMLKYEGYNLSKGTYAEDGSILLNYRPKLNISYGVSFNLLHTLHLDLGFNRYRYHLPFEREANYEQTYDFQITNYVSQIGANIGKKISLTPYVVWGLTHVMFDSYSMYFDKYKVYDGSWDGVTLTYGFGAKVSCFAFEPLFCSFGFSKMYPWMAGDLFDSSIMHEAEGSIMNFNTAVKQLNFQLFLGYIIGKVE
ncbi:MAG: hypothetical protein PHT69_15860 [Bacteroidales bacterium]|nr:hypothetical protein [Bacteroidales bacterium]